MQAEEYRLRWVKRRFFAEDRKVFFAATFAVNIDMKFAVAGRELAAGISL
jgi:hypothetical protein